jgi:hypothetical protein
MGTDLSVCVHEPRHSSRTCTGVLPAVPAGGPLICRHGVRAAADILDFLVGLISKVGELELQLGRTQTPWLMATVWVERGSRLKPCLVCVIAP